MSKAMHLFYCLYVRIQTIARKFTLTGTLVTGSTQHIPCRSGKYNRQEELASSGLWASDLGMLPVLYVGTQCAHHSHPQWAP